MRDQPHTLHIPEPAQIPQETQSKCIAVTRGAHVTPWLFPPQCTVPKRQLCVCSSIVQHSQQFGLRSLLIFRVNIFGQQPAMAPGFRFWAAACHLRTAGCRTRVWAAAHHLGTAAHHGQPPAHLFSPPGPAASSALQAAGLECGQQCVAGLAGHVELAAQLAVHDVVADACSGEGAKGYGSSSRYSVSPNQACGCHGHSYAPYISAAHGDHACPLPAGQTPSIIG